MPTGTGPGSGSPTSCADRLAAVNAQIEAIQKQYRDLDVQINALIAESDRLQGIVRTIWRGDSSSPAASTSVAVSVASVAQALGQADATDTAATVEVSAAAGLSPVVLLLRRATELGVRLSDLERRV